MVLLFVVHIKKWTDTSIRYRTPDACAGTAANLFLPVYKVCKCFVCSSNPCLENTCHQPSVNVTAINILLSDPGIPLADFTLLDPITASSVI
jgi:hypothetical protein